MKFEIEPDPAHPFGGHALLILPEGASAGSGHMVVRRSYDNRHLGADGWQAAQTTLGPLVVSHHGSGFAVALGPEVVAHLEEFDALEIAFEGGANGSAIWPEDVLLPPDAAAAGGLRRAPGTQAEPDEAASVGVAPLPSLATGSAPRPGAEAPSRIPPEAPLVPEPETPPGPPPESRTGSRMGLHVALTVAAVAIIAVVAALTFIDFDRTPDIPDIPDIPETAETPETPETAETPDRDEEAGEDCSEAAFAADPESDPASRIELVRRCAGAEGVSPEARLAVIERLLNRNPEARVVMGRWYDPVHWEEDFSPFDLPAIETAARYYFEAKEAGATDAQALLLDVCGRLDSKNLMQGNALHLYCPAR